MSRMIATRALLFLFLIAPSFSMAAGNQLSNPGFEQQLEGWSAGAGKPVGEARTGTGSCLISQTQAGWVGVEQGVFLPKDTAKVVVSGHVKTRGVVPGKESWEQARINLEFRDAAGALSGGYQASAGLVSGDSDWVFITHDYSVPAGAQKALVQCQLANCAGSAWFDDLDVRLLDSSGKELSREQLTGPADFGTWYSVEPPKNGETGSWVDWSSLLDAPAGKHGFLRAENGKLKFEDGTPARFWGTNLVADNIFANHEKADRLAERLSRMGVNLLRLHHMDAPWSRPNLFDNKPGTRALGPESLEKLDYLVSALKKKGVYVYLDILVHRDFTPADGVTDRPPDLGGKQVAFFAPKIIELQKEYVKQLLTHVNPYTGLAYKDEPALAGSEFINESTPYLHFGGDLLGDGPYRKILERLWEKSPHKNKTLGRFEQDWENHARLRTKGGWGDGDDMLKFFFVLHTRYLVEMTRFFRQVGYKPPLAGSNMPVHILADKAANSRMDVILFNGYWDHPQLWKINNDWGRILQAPIDNKPQIGSPSECLVSQFAKARVSGKPFMVTEWNDCYPNEYRLEGPPLMASYACLQDWDGMLQFDYDHVQMGELSLSAFELSRWPDGMAQWVVAAPLFHRRDVKLAPGHVVDRQDEKSVLSLPSYSDFIDREPWLPFVTRFSTSLMDEKPGLTADWEGFRKHYDREKGIVRSETGELTLRTQERFFEVDTPRCQGALGAWDGRKVDFGAFSAEIKNPWASVFMISKDAVPLESVTRAYLVVTTSVKMTGQAYQPDRGALKSPGIPPVLAQVAEGTVVLKRPLPATKVAVRPLSTGGVPGKPLKLQVVPGGVAVPLTNGRSFVYEVTYQ